MYFIIYLLHSTQRVRFISKLFNRLAVVVVVVVVVRNRQMCYKCIPVLIRKNMFPERRKLLTDDQYRKEGIRETNKALNALKGYCSSPECNPWKTILRLKDPLRLLYEKL